MGAKLRFGDEQTSMIQKFYNIDKIFLGWLFRIVPVMIYPDTSDTFQMTI